MRKDLELQFNYLDIAVEQLNQPITMLNVLRNRTSLDCIDIWELQQILKGIEKLIQKQVKDIQERIATIAEKGGENA